MFSPRLIAVVIVTPGVKPDPVTVTEAPLGPRVGLRVIPGRVIVKLACSLSKLPSEPVAVTLYGVPDTGPVIVTPQLNEPSKRTVAPHEVIEVPDPSIVVVITAPGVNPAPVRVEEAPLGPWVGARVIVGVVMVNVAVALSRPPSEPVAVTV
jgi:hypothetical protein